MDDEDRKRAANIEYMANCTYMRDEFDKKFSIYSHVKYDNKYFTVGRHTVGHYSVLGMPSLRAQMDPAIPTFSTDRLDFKPLLDMIGDLEAGKIGAEKEVKKEEK
jgi:hypothetical protein